MNCLYKKIIFACLNPSKSIDFILSKLLGNYYKVKYSYILRRAKFGKGIRIRGKLQIRGPGKVVFGDNVQIEGRGHIVTPFTHDKEAIIRIGSNSFVNGTRFGCKKNITIGDYAILGDARIMDTDFHSIAIDRWTNEAIVETAPIKIGKNVWIGGGAAVLKGVHIGDNSVIGFGSVVGRDVPQDCVVAGNPAKKIKDLKN